MKKKVISFLVVITVSIGMFAGCSNNDGKTPETNAETSSEANDMDKVEEADLVVVGGGGAGLSAALTAAEEGLNVIVLEKMPFVGGNMLVSAGIIQAGGTNVQKEFDIEGDSAEKFMDDLTIPNSPYSNPERPLSTIMHEGSRDMIDELADRGLEFAGFDAVNKRYHFIAPFGGGAPNLVKLLKEEAEKAGATILTDTEVTELILDGDTVVGVKAKRDNEEIKYMGKGVLLATGGFAANQEMVSEYMPQFAGLPTWSFQGATGDGIKMAEKVNASITAIDSGMHVALVNPETNMLTSSSDGILVNANGTRFFDETDILYSERAKATIEQPNKEAYVIIDDEILKNNNDTYNAYIEKDVAISAESLEELAEKLEMDNLIDTVNNYNDMANKGEDKDFGRSFQLNAFTGKKFYAIKVVPHPYNTYGGVEIDEKTHVLNEDGKIIDGLYAAGEVTGSVEVQEGLEYTTGNGQALVFGRLAVKTLIEDIK